MISFCTQKGDAFFGSPFRFLNEPESCLLWKNVHGIHHQPMAMAQFLTVYIRMKIFCKKL